MFGFFRKYHYVPPCPKCGSYKTGRFIYINNQIDVEKIIANNLKKGELSQVQLGFGDELEYNAYCEDCGIRWMAKIEELPLTEERIKTEAKKRQITKTAYHNMANYKKNRKKKLKEEKKALKLERKKAKKAKKPKLTKKKKQVLDLRKKNK